MGPVIDRLSRSARVLGLMATATAAVLGTATGAAAQDHAHHGAGHSMPNTLTDAERAAGWQLLFDGKTTAGWRAYNADTMSTAWTAEDGVLVLSRTRDAADIITTKQYGDFELVLEWRLSPEGRAGNSGIFYRAPEMRDTAIYWGAPEMQILDDARHGDGRNDKTSTGANYGLHGVPHGAAKPVGEWNTVRIVAKGAHIEHWLNDKKIVEYELWSPEWEALVQASKFAPHTRYGRSAVGHIGLQQHGSYVGFRNIKIRELR
jgi:hypothetical protein